MIRFGDNNNCSLNGKIISLSNDVATMAGGITRGIWSENNHITKPDG